jgi:hypothetical protein
MKFGCGRAYACPDTGRPRSQVVSDHDDLHRGVRDPSAALGAQPLSTVPTVRVIVTPDHPTLDRKTSEPRRPQLPGFAASRIRTRRMGGVGTQLASPAHRPQDLADCDGRIGHQGSGVPSRMSPARRRICRYMGIVLVSHAPCAPVPWARRPDGRAVPCATLILTAASIPVAVGPVTTLTGTRRTPGWTIPTTSRARTSSTTAALAMISTILPLTSTTTSVRLRDLTAFRVAGFDGSRDDSPPPKALPGPLHRRATRSILFVHADAVDRLA